MIRCKDEDTQTR